MIPPSCPEPLQVLHALVDGRPAPECVRSWFGTVCPHHAAGEKKLARPQLCALQRCESSAESNMLERARDSWDGTADTNARGLRHFGAADLAVFIFTLPEELRPRCVEGVLSIRDANAAAAWKVRTGLERKRPVISAVRDFRQAAAAMALTVLRRHVGNNKAEFFAKGWLHPEGDERPGSYLPHENILVPLAYYDPGRNEGHRIGRCKLPASYLGKDGWVAEAWRSVLVEIFGQWWTSSRPPPVNWFYEWKSTPEKKIHAMKYFPRTFPAWAGHPDVPVRPRSIGLAHWKKRSHTSRGAVVKAVVAAPVRPIALEPQQTDAFRSLPAPAPPAATVDQVVIADVSYELAPTGPGARKAPCKDWLSSVLARCGDPLPRWDECKDCVKECVAAPPKVAATGSTPEMVAERLDAAVRAHRCTDCGIPDEDLEALEDQPYLEYRRTMERRLMGTGPTGPPSTADPPPEWVSLETGELVVGTYPGPSWRRYAQ